MRTLDEEAHFTLRSKALRRSQPCWTGRKYISVVETTQSTVLFYGSPSKLTQYLYISNILTELEKDTHTHSQTHIWLRSSESSESASFILKHCFTSLNFSDSEKLSMVFLIAFISSYYYTRIIFWYVKTKCYLKGHYSLYSFPHAFIYFWHPPRPFKSFPC